MRRTALRSRTPFAMLAAVAAATTATTLFAVPLRAQATAGPAVVQQVKVTIHKHDEGSCTGDIDDWREELTGWVGMPGTQAAANAAAVYPAGEGTSAYFGVVSRKVTAALCRAKCPDGECDDICRFTVEATGPAELSLSAEEEGARLGIHKSKGYTKLTYSGGTCPDMHSNDRDFTTLFHDYQIPDLGFIPGDVSMKQLQTGLSLPVESMGVGQVGTLEVLAGCNDPTFNPGAETSCGPARKPTGAKKKKG